MENRAQFYGYNGAKRNSLCPCTFNMTTIEMHSFSELLFFRKSLRKKKMTKIAIKISKANYAKMAINFLFRKLYRFDTYRQNNSDSLAKHFFRKIPLGSIKLVFLLIPLFVETIWTMISRWMTLKQIQVKPIYTLNRIMQHFMWTGRFWRTN